MLKGGRHPPELGWTLTVAKAGVRSGSTGSVWGQGRHAGPHSVGHSVPTDQMEHSSRKEPPARRPWSRNEGEEGWPACGAGWAPGSTQRALSRGAKADAAWPPLAPSPAPPPRGARFSSLGSAHTHLCGMCCDKDANTHGHGPALPKSIC